MASKTIAQRITLVGGKEISTELRNLGKTGEEAFKNIQQAADRLKGPGQSFQTSMKNVAASLKEAGAATAEFGRNIRQMGQTVSIIGGAIAGLGVGFVALAKKGADAATAMGENAQRAGTTIDEFGRLSFAASQAGVDTESFTASMGRLSNTIDAAHKGIGPAAVAFEKLGVKVEGANGKIRPTELIMQDLAAAFNALPDGAEKSALAIDLFGRSGINLIPFLNQGKQAIIDLGKEAERLGLIFSPEEFAIGDTLGDELDKMKLAVSALADHIGLVFAPAITEMATAISDFVANNKDSFIAFAETVRDTFASIPDGVKIALGALAGITIALGPAMVALGAFIQVVGFSLGGLARLTSGITFLIAALVKLGAGLVTAGVRVGAFLVALGPMGLLVGAIVIAIVALAIAIVKNWDTIKKKFEDAKKSIQRTVKDIVKILSVNPLEVFAIIFRKELDALKNYLNGWVEFIKQKIQGLIDSFKQLIGLQKQAAQGGGQGGIGANARGGFIRGPGTSTSDSILSRLSTGEFVIRAAAVRKYGKELFAALNAMRVPKGGFSTGGLVRTITADLSQPLRGYASGGPVVATAATDIGTKNLGSLNLSINGKGGEIVGPIEVLEALFDAARDADFASAGPAPGYVR